MSKNIKELLIESGAMLDGHFLLTSGRHSNIYIEKFRLLENPIYLNQVCLFIAKEYNNDKIDIILGAAIGGILISGGVGRHLNKKHFFTERVNGKMKLRRGFHIQKNQNILIVEDIVTTGSSVFELIDLVESLNGKVVSVSCIVDRSKRGIDFKVNKNTLLTLPSEDWNIDSCPLCKQGVPLTSRGRTGK